MTVQKRTLIEPSDIIGIEYECSHCGSRYLVQVIRFDRRVAHCPNCHEPWLAAGAVNRQSDDQAVAQLVDALKEIQSRKLGVVVRLELANAEEIEC